MRFVAHPRRAVANLTIALGAHALEMTGRIMPGLPRSTIRPLVRRRRDIEIRHLLAHRLYGARCSAIIS